MVLKIEHQFIHEFQDRSTLFQRRKARLEISEGEILTYNEPPSL
jgi:hypothetical protein